MEIELRKQFKGVAMKEGKVVGRGAVVGGNLLFRYVREYVAESKVRIIKNNFFFAIEFSNSIHSLFCRG